MGPHIRGRPQISVYDVNGDGLNDVVTSMQAHGWGLAWFEQKRSSRGEISFVKHVIMGRTPQESAGGVVFTEPMVRRWPDMDGDGIPDLIVGKRLWSHLDTNTIPMPTGQPSFMCIARCGIKSAPGGARFVPELIIIGPGLAPMFLQWISMGTERGYRNFDPQRNLHFLGHAQRCTSEKIAAASSHRSNRCRQLGHSPVAPTRVDPVNLYFLNG